MSMEPCQLEPTITGTRCGICRNLRTLILFCYEYSIGLWRLRDVTNCITVFGSARINQGHPYYPMTLKLGEALANAGYAVMTGGGPGLMEAANRGCQQGKGHSVGCTIQLPEEQHRNHSLDTYVELRYFFVRKILLARYAKAFIAVPGGFGTLDELFEMLTLIQTGRMCAFPIVLLGKAYWQPMMDFIKNSMIPAGTITPTEYALIFLTDDIDAAIDHIQSTLEPIDRADTVNHS